MLVYTVELEDGFEIFEAYVYIHIIILWYTHTNVTEGYSVGGVAMRRTFSSEVPRDTK